MTPRVSIYGKPECCLCDKALKVLDEVQQQISFEIDKRDISGDAELIERYGLDIPVILVDGEVAFKHRIDKERLLELLGGR